MAKKHGYLIGVWLDDDENVHTALYYANAGEQVQDSFFVSGDLIPPKRHEYENRYTKAARDIPVAIRWRTEEEARRHAGGRGEEVFEHIAKRVEVPEGE